MKTYANLVAEATKAKKLSTVKIGRWKGAKQGEQIAGLLIGKKMGSSPKYDGQFGIYTFKTDNGLVDAVPGKAFDSIHGQAMEIGQIYVITREGETDTGKGNPMKDFKLQTIPASFASRE